MAGRKMAWNGEPGAAGAEAAAPVPAQAQAAAPAQAAEDRRDKTSQGMPEWTLTPPSVPLKRLVRKRT